MAVFKQCEYCGLDIHGGDGFWRKDGKVFCCPEHAQQALGITEWYADTLYTELDDSKVDDRILPHEQLLYDMNRFIDHLDTLFECLDYGDGEDPRAEEARELVRRFEGLYRI